MNTETIREIDEYVNKYLKKVNIMNTVKDKMKL